MKELKLTSGQIAFVDDEDFARLDQFCWRANAWGYPIRSQRISKDKGTTIRLAREIMNAPKGIEVDHINRDPLDNRRSNLRLVTKRQNVWNSGARVTNRLGIKGVGWRPDMKKFQVKINTGEGMIHIGYFETAEAAREAYNKKVTQLRGAYACIS